MVESKENGNKKLVKRILIGLFFFVVISLYSMRYLVFKYGETTEGIYTVRSLTTGKSGAKHITWILNNRLQVSTTNDPKIKIGDKLKIHYFNFFNDPFDIVGKKIEPDNSFLIYSWDIPDSTIKIVVKTDCNFLKTIYVRNQSDFGCKVPLCPNVEVKFYNNMDSCEIKINPFNEKFMFKELKKNEFW